MSSARAARSDFLIARTLYIDQNLQRFVSGEGLTVGAIFFMGGSGENGPFMVVAELGVQPPQARPWPPRRVG